MPKSLIEHSRTEWTPKGDDGSYPGNERVTIGCLQRIANATELMSKNYVAMQNDLERYKRWYNDEQNRRKKLERSNAALSGHIKRLKK